MECFTCQDNSKVLLIGVTKDDRLRFKCESCDNIYIQSKLSNILVDYINE